MRLVVVEGVEPGGVAGAVDARTYARGALLARRRAVVEMDWDGRYAALHTVVRDEGDVPRGGRLLPCTRGAAALRGRYVHMSSRHELRTRGGLGTDLRRTALRPAAGAEQQPSWERTLRSLFAPEPPSLADLRNPVPLALELSLSAGPGGLGDAVGQDRPARPYRMGRRWPDAGTAWPRTTLRSTAT